ncbi:MAG TPA: exodeoxyribonuclease V subunit gamma, partial [Xanthomonadaceae bacterium]|nr:exodeoxyribonuclease V subunit gamma [Xanthomonadaceae bacterium]
RRGPVGRPVLRGRALALAHLGTCDRVGQDGGVPSPDFRLYHSNALEVLAGLLAAEVARLPADGDWLRPDVVLVPQYSMRRWLQQALAGRLGICANLRFLTPGEFVDLALERNLGPAAEGERLAPEVLRWHLLREFDRHPPAGLAGFLDDRDPRKTWSLANALADIYEKYQAWRRDWLLRWERGAEAGDFEAELWRRVARGRAHRARRLDAYLRHFGAEGEVPAGLPPRLFVFACQNVSPDVLQVIASQARAGVQHFYLHTPARAYWGDLARWAADYVPADDDAFLGERPNPLLAAWGQAGRDFIAALGGGEAVRASFELVPFAEPPRDTLLGRLQADILDNRAPLEGNADDAWPRAQVDRHDASLQFHACHTRLREVQVLHDQLRALLEAPAEPGRPALQPRDIAVLAPDIDLYAPHVEAVFGGALGTPRELPYTIADTSPLASAPVAEAFLRLLELPLRAPGLGDVIDLLAVPAIAARFGVDDAERGRLQDWLQAAGARWGLDAADRAQHDAASDDGAYTFEFALQRLLLGYATGADADVATVAPWPELEGQAAATLEALLRFLALLREARARLAAAQPPEAWQDTLTVLLDDAFAAERDTPDEAVLRRLREAIAGFAEGAGQAGYDAPVAHAVVLEYLRAELAQADARAPFLSGGICFGRMVPMRLIPFRVICLLGMDEASFPARDARDPLNHIARALDSRERRVGDPSRRDADRYLFLQLLSSAGRTLYLSWCGMDPRDNTRREPSAVVSELLDAAAHYHAGEPALVREALVVRHALQPFAPAAFGAAHEGERLPDGLAVEPRRFSHDARWHLAGAAHDAAAAQAPPVFAPPTLLLPRREQDESAVVGLDRLRRTLQRPHAVYLQEGLGLRLPEEEPPLPEHEPLGPPDALGNHALRHAVFRDWLARGARPEARALHARLLARALVAPGADGRAIVADTLEDIAHFAALALEAGFGAEGARMPVAVALGRHVVRGALDGVHDGRVLRVVLNPGGVHGGHVVRHGLDHLCAASAGLALHELAVPAKGEPPALTSRPALAAAEAADILESLLAVREQALRAPLVFLPKAGYRYVRVLDEKDEHAAVRAARDCWLGSEWQADRAEAGPATRIALRGRDPFLDGDAAARARFAATATEVFAALSGARPADPERLR